MARKHYGAFWIKVEHTTPAKPEVVAMAAELGRSTVEVFGALVRLWIWADQHVTDGNARGVTETFMDDTAGLRGLVAAMEKHGWISRTKRGWKFVNYDRHMSESAKKRAITADRVRRFRNADVTPQALPDRDRDRDTNTPPKAPPRGGRLRRVEKPEDLV